jgi:predicted Zn-dependent protease with MMP-like domain
MTRDTKGSSQAGKLQGDDAARRWRTARAPDLAEFEELADAAWRGLPRHFRDLCGDVVVRVEEFASEEVLRELAIDDPFALMGLYQGISLNRRSVMDVLRTPNMVFLYRRALLDCWAEGEETLGHLVTHVLIHEIGHHFGLSDADMARIEAAAE